MTVSVSDLRRENRVLLATVLASGMAFIAAGGVTVALPAAQQALDMSGTELLWVANAFVLVLSALILVGGSLGDHYGRRRVFSIGVAIFLAGSVACALVANGSQFILARALQGLGGALMVPGSLAILSASVPEQRRGRAIGLWSTFSTAILALGPVLGGWLAGQGLWRGVFLINVPLGIVVLLAIRAAPESWDDEVSPKLDWSGAILITAALASLTYGIAEGPGRGWTNPLILLTITGGVAGFFGFLYVESHSDHPMIQLSLFRSSNFSGANLITFLLYAAQGAIFVFMPLMLIQTQGYSESAAGLALIPFVVAVTVLSPWSGGLADRIGPRTLLVIGPLVTAAGMAALAVPGLSDGAASYWTQYFPGVLLFGIGFGLMVAPLTTTVMKSAPDHSAGSASGINNSVSRVGSVLAVALFGAFSLMTFSQLVTSATADHPLPLEAHAAIQDEVVNLGAAVVPGTIPPELQQEVAHTFELSSMTIFRFIALASAGLALLGALAGYRFIR